YLIALAATDCNIVALDPTTGLSRDGMLAPSPGSELVTRRAYKLRFAAAAITFGVAVAVLTWLTLYHDPSYGTERGEHRSVTLAGGSSVELNAVSKIRVRFSTHERAVDLLAGQALFRVAKDATRPFVVVTGDTHVRAVGTQFDVNRKGSRTIVTVLEGRVSV